MTADASAMASDEATVEDPLQLIVDSGVVLAPDYRRVIARLFIPGHEDVGPGDSRAGPVIERLLKLSESDVHRAIGELDRRFAHRHRDLHRTFRLHADLVGARLDPTVALTDTRRLLLGATFTHEYTIEGASLCNPSAVLFPEMDRPGQTAFVMSVRCIGEGHRSSIGFRTGYLSDQGEVTINPTGRFPEMAIAGPGLLKKSVFRMKLNERTEASENAAFVLDHLPAYFTGDELDERIAALAADTVTRRYTEETILHLTQLAHEFYAVEFDRDTEVDERVLWPRVAAEQNGMEDARFVRFVDDSGFVTYYATYTAFDGTNIAQHLLETTDFRSFSAAPMAGAAATGKGLALFPRRIGGKFVALSRSDRESNSIAFSDDVSCWPEAEVIQVPEQPWETIQLGNCGSPIETDAGWLVLTHGVGPMRTYSLGALLLDLDDPRRVVAYCAQPLLTPSSERQNGYVPNVLYTCGAFLRGDTLVLPYAIADQSIAISTLSVSRLLTSMTPTHNPSPKRNRRRSTD